VLLHFENDFDGVRNSEAVAYDPESLIDRRQMSFFELDVHCRPCDLYYVSDVFWHKFSFYLFKSNQHSAISIQPLGLILASGNSTEWLNAEC
jgi:hypothetical protein